MINKPWFWPLILGVVMGFLVHTALKADAHEYFSGAENINGGSCCGGADCRPIPIGGSVEAVPGGYIVTLTKEQMVEIRPDLIRPPMMHHYGPYGGGTPPGPNPIFKALVGGIREFIPSYELQTGPDGYALCLGDRPVSYAGSEPRWISCFFGPGNA